MPKIGVFVGIGIITLTSVLVLPTTYAVTSTKTYTVPSSFTLKPASPEIRANEGINLRKDIVSLIVSPGTTPWDAYISMGTSNPLTPIRLCRYWKLTDVPVYEFELRSHFNNALIDPRENTLLTFHYQDEHLQVLPFLSFPEESLKIAESADRGETWTMLRNTVVDVENNTVSAVVKLNKGYMLVAGFVNPRIYCNYDLTKVLGAYVPKEPENITQVDRIIESIRFKMIVGIEYIRYEFSETFLQKN